MVGLVESCVDPDLDVSDLVVEAIIASLDQSAINASLVFGGILLSFGGFGAENDGMRATVASMGCEYDLLGEPGGDAGGEKSVML